MGTIDTAILIPHASNRKLGTFVDESSSTTVLMCSPPISANKRSTPAWSKRSSLESMNKKNVSSVTRSKRGSVNMGLLNFGSPLSAHIPKNAPNEASKIVSSNATGMKAGSEINGLPEMMYG